MKNTMMKFWKIALFAGMLLGISVSCDRDDTEGLELAAYPKTAEIFTDTPVGLGSDFYFPYAEAKATAWSVDDEVGYNSSASMRIDVPNADDPAGSYAGGILRIDGTGRDLSGYNCLTFYIKASQGASIDVLGFGTDYLENAYKVSIDGGVKVNTAWQKVIIPIPDPSKLINERGVFEFAMGTQATNGLAYTVWIDEVKFENLGTIAKGRPMIQSGADDTATGVNGSTIALTGLTETFNLATGEDVTINVAPAYYTFISSDESVAKVDALGTVTFLSKGTAKITAKLGGEEVKGSLTVVSTGDFQHAPKPETEKADVISIYSDAYDNVNVDFTNGYWAPYQTTESADFDVENDHVLNYTNFNFVGIQFANPTVDATNMKFMHFDLFFPKAMESPSLIIKLKDFGADGVDGGTDDAIQEYSVSDFKVGEWISLDIPLTIARSKIGQIVLEGANVENFYVDNIYFAKEKSGEVPVEGGMPKTAAPEPTHDANNVISIYSEKYTNIESVNLNPGWGQATTFSEEAIDGNNTIKLAELNYQGIDFESNKQDVSGYESLHVDYWTGNATTLQFFLISNDGSESKEKPYTLTVPTNGDWSSVDISLSEFSDVVDLTNVFQMKIVGDGDVYIDNIYFHTPTSSTGSTASSYCNTEVTHFGIAAETASAIKLSIGKIAEKQMKIQIESSDSDPVDALIVNNLTGAITGAPAVSEVDSSVAGKLSVVLTWTDTPPAEVELCVLWSKESNGGNWQLSQENVKVNFADECASLDAGSTGGTTVATAPTEGAPAPTKPETDVISIYSDKYTDISNVNLNPGWGQATAFSEETIDGNATIKLAGLNYQGIDFESNKQDVSALQYIHLDYWTADATTLQFFVISNDGSETKEKAYTLTVPTNGDWSGVDISLSEFSDVVDLTNVFQMKIVGDGDVYIDNIYFHTPTSSTGGGTGETVQNFPIDFEDGKILSGCFDGGANGANASNPDASGINTSSKVYQFNKIVGSAWYSGMYNVFSNDIDMSKGTIFKVKVYSPSANVNFRFQLEEEGGDGTVVTYQFDQTVTEANTWVELTFDFSSVLSSTSTGYNKIVIFPDYDESDQTAVATEATYYIDDIVQE